LLRELRALPKTPKLDYKGEDEEGDREGEEGIIRGGNE